MRRSLIPVLLWLFSSPVAAGEYLLATSLTGAARTDADERVSTAVLAPRALVALDEGAEVVLLSHFDPDGPAATLSVDDALLAARNGFARDAQPPGVSLDPLTDAAGNVLDEDVYEVRLTGTDVVDSPMGQRLIRADMLLKLFSERGIVAGDGLRVAGEWQRDLDELRGGATLDEDSAPMNTYFFPTDVRVARGDAAVTLQSVTVEVLTGFDGLDELGRALALQGIPLATISRVDTAAVADIDADELPEMLRASVGEEMATSVADAIERYRDDPTIADANAFATARDFAQALSTHYEVLELRYPELRAFREFFAIYALTRALNRSDVGADALAAIDTAHLPRAATPRRITPLVREVAGYAYGLRSRGGLVVHPTVYRARAGAPDALRKLARAYRPRPGALQWLVPIDAGATARPDPGMLARLADELAARRRPFSEQATFELTAVTTDRPWDEWPALVDIEALPPATVDDLVEIRGRAHFGTGSDVALRADQLYIEPPRDVLALTYDLSARYVWRNRAELAVAVPLKYRVSQIPASEKLPDLYEFGHALGTANLRIGGRYLLFDGTDGAPSVSLQGGWLTPLAFEVFNDGPDDDFQRNPTAVDGSVYYAGADAEYDFSSRWSASLGFFANRNEHDDARGEPRSGIDYQVELGGYRSLMRPALRVGARLRWLRTDAGDSQAFELAASGRDGSESFAGLQRLPNGSFYYYYRLGIGLGWLDVDWRRWL